MGSQIQNPFDSGAGYFGNALNQFNKIDLVGSVADLGRTINAGNLSDLMAQNGGMSDQSMNPLAMLATPEAQKAFQSDLALQRTDRGLGQQDVQLGISQQNADTSRYSAETGRMNYGLNNRKYNDMRSDAAQLGAALSGAVGPNAANNPIMNYIIQNESGGNFNAKNPSSTAFGIGQLTDATNASAAKLAGLTPEEARKPENQLRVMSALMESNAKILKSYGVPVTPETALQIHQMGAPTFKRFIDGTLTSDDKKRIAHLSSYKRAMAGQKGSIPSALRGITMPKGPVGVALANLLSNAYTGDVGFAQTLAKDDYTTANDYMLAQQKANAAAKSKMAQAEVNRLLSMAKNESNPTTRNALFNEAFDIGSAMGADVGVQDLGVPPKLVSDRTDVVTRKNNIATVANITNPEHRAIAIQEMKKNDGALPSWLLEEQSTGNYAGSTIPPEQRIPLAQNAIKALRDKGYDTDWYDNLPFSNVDDRFSKLTNALSRVITPSDALVINSENLPAMNKVFNKIGFEVHKTKSGSNFKPTKRMQEVLVANKTFTALVSEAQLKAVEKYPNNPAEQRNEMKRILSKNPAYKKAKRVIQSSPYPRDAIEAANAID